MSKYLTDTQAERICDAKGYIDMERCAATARVTAFNPRSRKFVLVRADRLTAQQRQIISRISRGATLEIPTTKSLHP